MHCSRIHNRMKTSQGPQKQTLPSGDAGRPPEHEKEGPRILRRQPGEGGGGKYYHILLRPKGRFVLFRTVPVVDTYGVLEVLGRKPTDEWEAHKILVRKDIAVQKGRELSVMLHSARFMLPELRGPIRQLHDDVFVAKPFENVEIKHSQQSEPASHAISAGRKALRQKLERFATTLAR